MKQKILLFLVPGLVFGIVSPFLACSTFDTIELQNNAGSDMAIVLYDGYGARGCLNDAFKEGNGVIELSENISTRTICNSEIIVFSQGDSMKLIPNVSWTGNNDEIHVDLTPDLLKEKVTLWIIRGPFNNNKILAEGQVALANQLYNTMNCGIGFEINGVNDKTTHSNFLDINCHDVQSLRNQNMFTQDQLNVYYVGTIDPGTSPPGAPQPVSPRGIYCPGENAIIISSTADDETLAHEIGHAFSLKHTNLVGNITNKNLMWSGGTGRDSITEGQCFRCNINEESTLNTNGTRNGLKRDCGDGITGVYGNPNKYCPSLSTDY